MGLHIGCIPGAKRGAMIRHHKEPLAPRDERRVSRWASDRRMPSGLSVIRSSRPSRAEKPGILSERARPAFV